jgi:hypothetical protein
MESAFGTDLSALRIHDDATAARFARGIDARAFTRGSHVYLAAGQSAENLSLLAHEAAHAVQQTATINAEWPVGPPAQAPPALTPAEPGLLQRDADAPSGAIGRLLSLARSFIPDWIVDAVTEISRVGLWNYLKGRLSSLIGGLFDRLRASGGTGASLVTLFTSLIARGRLIATALSAGDCGPLFAALNDMGSVLGNLAGRAWDRIVTFLTPIGDWFTSVWARFGAPALEYLQELGGDVWNFLCNAGTALWNGIKKLGPLAGQAWDAVKELLGIQSGADDGPGLVDWLKGKAVDLWNELKAKIQPVIDAALRLKDRIVALIPLDAIQRLSDKVMAWTDQATALADKMDNPEGVTENRDLLSAVIIPALHRGIASLSSQVQQASDWVTDQIGGVATQLSDWLSGLARNTLLSPFAGVLTWLGTEAQAVGRWVSGEVAGVFTWARHALSLLDEWLEPILGMLRRLVGMLVNLMDRFTDLIPGRFWNAIPKCIRDPVKDFLVKRVLSQIPVFADLLALPDIWTKVKGAFERIIIQVFRDGRLAAAAWSFFSTVLDLLGVPPSLVTKLIRNAANAIRDILRDPVGFMRNILAALREGLSNFIDNIGTHLLNGALNWVLSAVEDGGIKVPKPFSITLRNVLDLILQVLAITKEKIFQRIEKLKGREVADKARKLVAAAEKGFEWLSILIREGPAGLWKHLQGELSNLWDTMLNMAIDYLIGRFVKQALAWVAKTLASGGFSVIIDAIKALYDAMKVLARYLRQFLEIANSVCEGVSELARGVTARGAKFVEDACDSALPAVLAFIARTLGIGDLPETVAEGIRTVRGKVESAIDSLIERTFAAVDWLLQKGKDAVEALIDWWTAKEPFNDSEGKPHKVYLDGQADNARVMIASDPMDIDAAINAVSANEDLSAAEKTAHIANIRTFRAPLEDAVAELKRLNKTETPGNLPSEKARRTDALKKATAKLREQMRGLAGAIRDALFGDLDYKDLPQTKLTPDCSNSSKATKMVAEPLSTKGEQGSEPEGGAADPAGWSALQAAGFTTGGYEYKRMHLINARFGGKGMRNNLTPGSRQNNSNHLGSVENIVKQLVGDNRGTRKRKGVIWYEATVDYYSKGDEPGDWPTTFSHLGGEPVRASMFASAINLRWGPMRREGTTWVRDGNTLQSFSVAPIPLPPFKGQKP